MYDEVVVREIGKRQYLISQDESYLFRVALFDGIVYVSLHDLAACCGYQCPSKVAQISKLRKVKIRTRDWNTNRTFDMWYITLKDSVEYVTEFSMNLGFAKWYVNYSKEMTKLGKAENRAAPRKESVTAAPAAAARTTVSGVNILPEQIDKLIVELLTLKQSLLTN